MTARATTLALASLLLLTSAARARGQAPDPHAGHAGHATTSPQDPAPAPQAPDPHAGHRSPSAPGPSIPPVTDAMRAAAFPAVHGHETHDTRVNAFVLFDQAEWRSGHGPGTFTWSQTGWVGGDIHRVWLRSEGSAGDDGWDDAEAHVLFGRAVARWWDVVAGIRQDVRPDARTWFAVGVQGLAPGFFDVDATAYVSQEGQAAVRTEISWDLLLTNRLVLQPNVELDYAWAANASAGAPRGFGVDAGMRLRYHVSREVAPYVGVSWVTSGEDDSSSDGRRAANGAARLVTGLRVWF